MDTTGKIITISSGWMFLGLALLVLAYALMLKTALQGKKTKSQQKAKDWSVPQVDDLSGAESLFHRWDPRFKIASMVIYCFFVAALMKITTAFAALALSLVALILAKVPVIKIRRRLFAMAGFLGMFLIVMPLTVVTQPGDTLIYFTPFSFPFNLRGVAIAGRIILKACAIALLMEPIFATANLPVTIKSLRRLGVPEMICQMILLAHRYIFVFLHEMRRMRTGMQVRGFSPGTNIATMKVMGNFLGMLFVRSFDRTQRVYEAMLARGYVGSFPIYHRFDSVAADWLKAGVCIVLGIIFILVDKNIVHLG